MDLLINFKLILTPLDQFSIAEGTIEGDYTGEASVDANTKSRGGTYKTKAGPGQDLKKRVSLHWLFLANISWL